jgi:hypothetical protein
MADVKTNLQHEKRRESSEEAELSLAETAAAYRQIPACAQLEMHNVMRDAAGSSCRKVHAWRSIISAKPPTRAHKVNWRRRQ